MGMWIRDRYFHTSGSYYLKVIYEQLVSIVEPPAKPENTDLMGQLWCRAGVGKKLANVRLTKERSFTDFRETHPPFLPATTSLCWKQNSRIDHRL